MQLQTKVEFTTPKFTIGYSDKIISLGSCFADNIGNYLKSCQFNILPNPNGVIYNPISVLNTLQSIRANKEYKADSLVESGGLFHSMYHHGDFSKRTAEETINCIGEGSRIAHEMWDKCSLLLITFGTAWVYQYKTTGNVVANCHKLPASNFERRMVTVEEIVELWQKEIEDIIAERPNIKIIFTVSPIRHWKDGAHGNQTSKATLLLAIDKLVKQFHNVEYFPAYEIVMDELRDYRFYAEDMLHPSQVAIEYIKECFCKQFMDQPSLKIISSVEKYSKAVSHRPLHPESEEWQKFLKKREEQAKELAIELLHASNASCIILNNNKFHYFTERGIKDLYNLYKNRPEILKNSFIADKVVGKGAAALMALGEISELYTDIISEKAVKMLQKCKIIHSFAKQVPYIINRAGNGMCPVETLCSEIETPEECLTQIESFINKNR